jgi:hypothetical protein
MTDRLVAELEADATWRDARAFVARAEAMDALELYLIATTDAHARSRAVSMIGAMESLDRALFDDLRERIRRGDRRRALDPWLPGSVAPGQHYDTLDALLAGVLAIAEPDVADPAPPPDMVFYQPTPARHIVDGIRRAEITDRDVVLDLGSGLGHVPMLVHLLTGAHARGVEREPAYVDSASRAAGMLGLEGVAMAVGDARDATFARVDVFYLFTPFVGPVLRTVVESIETEARRRPVRVVALGPCTRTFARMPWLASDDPDPSATDRIVVFRSPVAYQRPRPPEK